MTSEMTNTEISPVGLTDRAKNDFYSWCEQVGCANPPSDLFGALNNFNDDHSSHIEVVNKAGRPDVYTFTKEDYIYA